MGITHDNALHGHTSEDTAYVVADYPYGYRLRTSIRYWIETNPRHGDRFVSQTVNPKTGRWNKPKASTYCRVGCMYLDDEGHVTWAGLHEWADEEAIAEFVSRMGELNHSQRNQVAYLKGLHRTFKDVTFTVEEGPRTPEQEAEQARTWDLVNRRVRYETAMARHEYPA